MKQTNVVFDSMIDKPPTGNIDAIQIEDRRGHKMLITYIDSTHVNAQNVYDGGELGNVFAMHIAEFDPEAYPGIYEQVHAFTHNR